jgi:hypothetical protein
MKRSEIPVSAALCSAVLLSNLLRENRIDLA